VKPRKELHLSQFRYMVFTFRKFPFLPDSSTKVLMHTRQLKSALCG
jgi:hypothetical protein